MSQASPHIFDMIRRWEAEDPGRTAVCCGGT